MINLKMFYCVKVFIIPIEKQEEDYLKSRSEIRRLCREICEPLSGYVESEMCVKNGFRAAFDNKELALQARDCIFGKLFTLRGIEYRFWADIIKPTNTKNIPCDRYTVETQGTNAEGSSPSPFVKVLFVDNIPSDRPAIIHVDVARRQSSDSVRQEKILEYVGKVKQRQHEDNQEAFDNANLREVIQTFRSLPNSQQRHNVWQRVLQAGIKVMKQLNTKYQVLEINYHGQVPETATHLLATQIHAARQFNVDIKLCVIIGSATHSPNGFSTLRKHISDMLMETDLRWTFETTKFVIWIRHSRS